jgi:hypothetical protein
MSAIAILRQQRTTATLLASDKQCLIDEKTDRRENPGVFLWGVTDTSKEKNSVKLKTLAVITLLVLGCGLASAQIGTFSFWNAAGTLEYCNFNIISFNGGGVVAGTDNISTFCEYTFNSAIIGFVATTPALGLPAHGKGAVLGDGIYDAFSNAFTGTQWTMWQSAKVSKKNKKTGAFTGPYGWVGVAGSYTGFYFGDNYGYLSAGFPEKGSGHGTTAGKLQKMPGIPGVW